MKSSFAKKMNIWGILALVILPVLTALICLCIGRMHITPAEVLASLFGHDLGRLKESVLWVQRLPRILTAAAVGSGLAVSGCVFQSMFSNPLATPDTLGVASGASFGAAVALLLGLAMPWVQAVAFAFGILAIVLTGLGGSRTGNKTSIILSGIMISSLFSALVSLVKYLADTESQLPAITYWLMGSLSASGYKSLVLGAPVIVVCLCVLVALRWRLNLLPLSDDEARSLGTNMKLLRGVAVVCAAGMTASAVSMCGQVGWVGLLVPHICRMLFGNNHKYLIPACISIGASFMVAVDTVARTLTASEIPISILTAIIGAPFFIVLLRRKGGWSL